MSKAKRITIIYALTILIAMSALLIFYFHSGNNISLDIQIEKGSLSDIDGLNIKVYPSLLAGINWTENITFNNSDYTYDTSMRFTSKDIPEWDAYITEKHFNSVSDYSQWLPDTPEIPEKVHKMIVEQGGENEAFVSLSELIDYYPCIFDVIIGGQKDNYLSTFFDQNIYSIKFNGKENINKYYNNGLDYSYLLDESNMDESAVNYRKLLSFLKIPVIKEQMVALRADFNVKTQTYDISSPFYSYSTNLHETDNKSDSFSFNPQATADENNIYIWFYNKTSEGNTVDTSQIPGGYGVYMLPYRLSYSSLKKSSSCSFDFDKMKNIFSVEEKAEILDVSVDTENRELLVYTRLEEKTYLNVISLGDFQLKQALEIRDVKANYIFPEHRNGKELIVDTSDVKAEIRVLKRDTDGKYSEVFYYHDIDKARYNYVQDFDVKDGRLVLVSIEQDLDSAYNNYTNQYTYFHGNKNLFEERIVLSVISQEGLVFYAKITSDLQKSNNNSLSQYSDYWIFLQNSGAINSPSFKSAYWIRLDEMKRPRVNWN